MPMTEQVALMLPHLKVGSNYLFEHSRKGPFVGMYCGTKPTSDGDADDSMFIEVDVITEDGSGQEGLANAFVRDEHNRKMRPKATKKYIRPSLLRTVTSPGQEAQQQMKDQFTRIREQADKIAAAGGVEPSYPTLSLPTARAIEMLGAAEKAPRRNTIRILVYAAVAAGAAAAGVVGYVLGGN
jgi:hypothetical protein